MRIYKKEELTEEQKLVRLPKDLQFLHMCPYFLNGKCSSYHWNIDSPCWDCYKKDEYIIRESSLKGR